MKISILKNKIKKIRDLRMIGYKLKYVLFPKMREEEKQNKSLRNWDLWGPLLLCLSLAMYKYIIEIQKIYVIKKRTLSIASSQQAEKVFAIIFILIWSGAVVITLNAKLLGGKISFFQSVCVLGYCIFPINIASFINLFIPETKDIFILIKAGICFMSFIWSTKGNQIYFLFLIKNSICTFHEYSCK
ncbi:Yip1 domain member 6 protein [Ichthyophthirius multifiliis]|uniref:Protein YIPF n=1 Tax=Ichthyophthirius multifiliis TaxID=5932 RepID=G0R322_ICHMU|nr:Yip1 domain member 6 protein [Ichthyophthirius multifiliis]EGR28128.1 Yip1 domain member 6 protein [Ichthyophthirius multifiliis]|eukprot:XP_004027473.1 Yip1 domain member 6 protein [Ichthyophthirius multifiliis]